MNPSGRTRLLLAAALLALFAAGKVAVTRVAEQRAGAFIEGLAPYASVRYGRLAVDLVAWDLVLSDVEILPVAGGWSFKADRIVVKSVRIEDDLPVSLSVRCEGLDIPVDREHLGPLAGEIAALGYPALETRLAIDYRYRPRTRELEIRALSCDLPDVGKVSVKADLGNVVVSPTAPSAAFFTIPYVTLTRATVRYEDDSLFGRILELAGTRTGKSSEEVLASLREELREERASRGEAASRFLEGIEHFLDDPERLEITLTADKPIPLRRLAEGEMEGVTVTVR